jgi:hypothetical protein
MHEGIEIGSHHKIVFGFSSTLAVAMTDSITRVTRVLFGCSEDALGRLMPRRPACTVSAGLRGWLHGASLKRMVRASMCGFTFQVCVDRIPHPKVCLVARERMRMHACARACDKTRALVCEILFVLR